MNLLVEGREGGEFVVLLGPSGCGKSTLLHLISGLLEPDDGVIQIYGQPLVGDNPYAVTVPQAYTCYPWLTAQENVEFGLRIRGMGKAERRERAAEYLEKVGLADRRKAYPRQLSGGMQQRVAIARTLAMRPSIVLMDEPFGALDAQTRVEMQQMLLEMWTTERSVVVFVTHDIGEAILLADRIVVLGRPARILADITVPFARPRLLTLTRSAEFMSLHDELNGLLKSQSSGKYASPG